MTNYFSDLWHSDWDEGIFTFPLQVFSTFNLITGPINHYYFNYAIPTASSPDKLNLKELESQLGSLHKSAAIYLTESHQDNGFTEFLIRHGYRLAESEVWLGYDPDTYKFKQSTSIITSVTPESFDDYSQVLSIIFHDNHYLDICRQTLTGQIKKTNIHSEFFTIYENNQPVSGAGLFYSSSLNFAYLHNGGTLEDFRKRGYQTDLIHLRTQKAISLGINRIYAIVGQGSQSWSNFIRAGFNQMQRLLILVKTP